MTKIAQIADTHIDTRHKRWPTLRRSLDTMIGQIGQAKPDLIVHAGDLGEKNPNDKDLDAMAMFLQGLAEFAPTVVCLGNHDARGHWEVLSKIDTRHQLVMVTFPETLCLLTDGALWNLEDLPEGDIDATKLIAHVLPWPAKGQLLANYPEAVAPEDSDRIALECLRSIFRGWRQEREIAGAEKADIPSILVGHLDLSGARGDQGQPLCTPDVSVSVYDLAEAGTDITMLGHIHAQQDHEIEPGILAWYSGSPCRLSWGEAGAEAKGWILYHADMPEHEVIEILSPRLWTVEAEWTQEYGPGGESLLWAFERDVHDPIEAAPEDELRFRYHVPEEQREAAKAAMEQEIQKIWPGPRENVTVEERVIPSRHARAPELVTEDDPVEQAKRYLALEHPEWTAEQIDEYTPLLREAVQGVVS